MTLILLLLCTSLHAQFAALYKPEGEPKAAVIVCPGGSYFWLDKEGEGSLVGDWLASQGIMAYVLHYRTAGWFDFAFRTRPLFGGNRHPDMISDLQWGLQSVRKEFDGPVFHGKGRWCQPAARFRGGRLSGGVDAGALHP